MLRALIIILFSAAMLSLPACSVFSKKPAADTAEATERTAYLTCGGCHGGPNVRVDFMSPKILGQKKHYLVTKMREFRDMKRIHPKMNGSLSELTDQDITNLADYYANYGKKKI